MIFCNSSTEILFESKYCKSFLETLSSIRFYTSSNVSLLSMLEATSAIVRETSDTLAFKESPALSSDLLALVGITLSSSLIARP